MAQHDDEPRWPTASKVSGMPMFEARCVTDGCRCLNANVNVREDQDQVQVANQDHVVTDEVIDGKVVLVPHTP